MLTVYQFEIQVFIN